MLNASALKGHYGSERYQNIKESSSAFIFVAFVAAIVVVSHARKLMYFIFKFFYIYFI